MDMQMSIEELEDLEEKCNLYMACCWALYNEAKALDPGNTFVHSLGKSLYKYKKLSSKQLKALSDTIEKKKGKVKKEMKAEAKEIDQSEIPW